MKSHRTDRLMLSMALAALMATPTAGADIAGQMLFVTGDVQIRGVDGTMRSARQGETVRDGEQVITGPGALGQVKLERGGFVGVRPGSELRFDPPGGNGTRSMQLDAGNVRLLNTEAHVSDRPLVLKTRHGQMSIGNADAVAGVTRRTRGAGADPSQPVTVLRVNRGTVTATDRAGNPQELASRQAAEMRPGRDGAGVRRLPDAAVRDILVPRDQLARGSGATQTPVPGQRTLRPRVGDLTARAGLGRVGTAEVASADLRPGRRAGPSLPIGRFGAYGGGGATRADDPPAAPPINTIVYVARQTRRLPGVAVRDTEDGTVNNALTSLARASSGQRLQTAPSVRTGNTAPSISSATSNTLSRLVGASLPTSRTTGGTTRPPLPVDKSTLAPPPTSAGGTVGTIRIGSRSLLSTRR